MKLKVLRTLTTVMCKKAVVGSNFNLIIFLTKHYLFTKHAINIYTYYSVNNVNKFRAIYTIFTRFGVSK